MRSMKHRIGRRVIKRRRRRSEFRVRARNLGRIRRGLSLDDVGGLLARLEGERRR